MIFLQQEPTRRSLENSVCPAQFEKSWKQAKPWWNPCFCKSSPVVGWRVNTDYDSCFAEEIQGIPCLLLIFDGYGICWSLDILEGMIWKVLRQGRGKNSECDVMGVECDLKNCKPHNSGTTCLLTRVMWRGFIYHFLTTCLAIKQYFFLVCKSAVSITDRHVQWNEKLLGKGESKQNANQRKCSVFLRLNKYFRSHFRLLLSEAQIRLVWRD